MVNNFLIVGLGNPGHEYEGTRHNVGFDVVNLLSLELSKKFDVNKFNGTYFTFENNNNKFFVCKPQTYMNLSGENVLEMKNFFKIPTDNILIIYDDIDTSIGKIKLKKSGNSGGQNGMKNIINLLGTNSIKRIKIGIGKPNIDLSKYVLSRFEINDLVQIKMAINNAKNALMEYIENLDFEKLMNKFNGS